MIKVQYMSKNGATLYTENSQAFKNDWNPFLSFVFHNGWLQNHCWPPAIGMTPYFVIFIYLLVTSNLLSYWLGYAISVYFC